jgi:hypothetical protein
MRALTASEKLRVWERGRRQTPVRRALLLLAAESPQMPLGEITRFSIGQRDARLLTLRELMFGSRIQGIAACPQCGERLELMFDVAEIRTSTGEMELTSGESHLLESGGYEIRFRPPDSNDVEAIGACQNVEAAREQLLARCTLEIKRGKKKAKESAAQLPSKVIAALVEKMAEADPQANVQLSLTCPACEHVWSAAFDIASFLWSEINDWAERILREIHVIASAYGWSESDILEMSAERRGFYIEMISGA